MEYKERLKIVIKEWLYYKTAININEDSLNVLVDRISECNKFDTPVSLRSAFLVQHKDSFRVHGLFDSEEKARKHTSGSDSCEIMEVEIY